MSSSLLHRKYLLRLCFLLKVSQYQLALIDTASVHIVKGISISIIKCETRIVCCNTSRDFITHVSNSHAGRGKLGVRNTNIITVVRLFDGLPEEQAVGHGDGTLKE